MHFNQNFDVYKILFECSFPMHANIKILLLFSHIGGGLPLIQYLDYKYHNSKSSSFNNAKILVY
jgi:hypothetical protein